MGEAKEGTEEDDANKRVTVPCRVHPETRDEWHDFVDDSDEWDSVSDLIRGAVYREIDGWYTQPGAPAGGSVEADVDLDPVLDALNNLSDDINSIEDRLDNIEDQEHDMMTLLAEDIRELIPQVNDTSEVEKIEADPRKTVKFLAEEAGSIDAIIDTVSARRGVREGKVRNAIDKLKEDLPASINEVQVNEGDHRLVEVR
ncbi:hypothetical protein [Halopiger aswanensis]|uniref:Uncharacterized protein n=1 Tax=Halopiger aswanensis TaxID=148449 RepID=A0A3R7DFC0_9EURY|nr:hypothetical protein [Halopiger aswanensis]RKD97816.1 hypothetical protein ATJ93_0808 [Halopiger aswanensis]